MRGIGRYKKSRVENAPPTTDRSHVVSGGRQSTDHRLQKWRLGLRANGFRTFTTSALFCLRSSLVHSTIPPRRSCVHVYGPCTVGVCPKSSPPGVTIPKHLHDTIRVLVPLMEGWKGALERLGQPQPEASLVDEARILVKTLESEEFVDGSLLSDFAKRARQRADQVAPEARQAVLDAFNELIEAVRQHQI